VSDPASGTPAGEIPTGTVTLVFTDIEGSTKLLHRLGSDYHQLLEDHHRLLRAAFAEGYVAGTEGDAFFVVFRSAPAAVEGVVAAQQALAAHRWPGGAEVKVRIGLHTGEVAIAGGDLVGIDVNRAARIAAAAHGGQILVSDATRVLVGGTLGDDRWFDDLGEHRLKDLPAPERLWQLSVTELPREFPPPRSLDARPTNLPAELTSFIGREQLVTEITTACRAHRLVTLTGPGGTGKSRLAVQAASLLLPDFTDGAHFVPLAPIADPELVATTIAGTLGVKEQADRSVVASLHEHLRDRALVLVLDNMEHVITAAPIVPELLAAAPGLHVLATSREALRVDGEQELPVPPMATPDERMATTPDGLASYESVALFLARARAIDPGFSLDETNAPAVAAICARLDGLPLAIELAAARVRLLTPAQILERLERALSTLTGGGRDRTERQQTLRGAIAWGYDLLDEAERACFRRLAVFRGGCTFEAAEAVCDPDAELGADALDLLGSLVDKSLVRRIETDDEPRLQMLFVIREFAREAFDRTDETDEIRRRHATWYLEMAREAAPQLFGAEQPRWLDHLEHEHDNMRAALDRMVAAGRTSIALPLAATLWRFWQMRGHLREARERITAVLALPDAADHPDEMAAALEAAGGISYWMGDWAPAGEAYERCLALRRTLGDPIVVAEAAFNLACIAVYGPEPYRSVEGAQALLDEALAIYRAHDDLLGEAKVLWATGGNLVDERPEDSIGPFHESLSGYRAVGDRFGEAWALHMLGIAEAVCGRLDDADGHMREALALFLAAEDRSALSLLLNDFAVVAVYRGDAARALTLHGAATELESIYGVGLGVTATDLGGVVELLWNSLPREEADRHFAAGRALSLDDALVLATKVEG